jgi:hypothetical protein
MAKLLAADRVGTESEFSGSNPSSPRTLAPHTTSGRHQDERLRNFAHPPCLAGLIRSEAAYYVTYGYLYSFREASSFGPL